MAVSISSIARSANVVTVATSSAHGLVASQGFAITAVTGGTTTFNINASISTVPDTTHFTFAQIGANESGAAGSVSPAKQIIVLDTLIQQYNTVNVHYILWLTTSKPYPLGSASSAWPGASPAENAAIAVGTTIELNLSKQLPASLSTASIQAILQAEYTGSQSYQQALAIQPGQYNGAFFDGGWH